MQVSFTPPASESRNVTSPAPSQNIPVVWQWEHKSGFRDFDAPSVQRIEKAYQRGITHVRLKSGKMGATPVEVFLIDMIQWNPVTGNVRSVRRVGPDSWWKGLTRYISGFIYTWETGKPRRVRFQTYSGRQSRKMDGSALHAIESFEGLIPAEESWCNRVVESTWFFPLCMCAIVANAVYLGIDADLNPDSSISYAAFSWFTAIENLFCVFFTAELLIRYGSYKTKWEFLQHYWFVFDGSLTLLMIAEVWIIPVAVLASSGDSGSGPTGKEFSILRIARLVKVSRLGRVIRLLRIFPEIMTLLKGIAQSMRSVFFTLLLLLILLFIFGILFKTQANNTPLQDTFTSVSQSMWILLLRGALLDEPSETINTVAETSPMLAVVFLIFIFLGSFTILNMLIGIVVEVVHDVSLHEKEQASISSLKASLYEVLECFDKDDDEHIHQDEFELLLRNPELKGILDSIGVNCLDLMSLRDVLFEDKQVAEPLTSKTSKSQSPCVRGDQSVEPTPENSCHQEEARKLTFDEFVEVVVRLRGGNAATVMDIVELRDLIRSRFARLEKLSESHGMLLATTNRSHAPLPVESQRNGLSMAFNGRTRCATIDSSSLSSSTLLENQKHGFMMPCEKTWQQELEALKNEWQKYYPRFRQELNPHVYESRDADSSDRIELIQKMQRQLEASHADILERICCVQKVQAQQEILHADTMNQISLIQRAQQQQELQCINMLEKIGSGQAILQMQEAQHGETLEKLCRIQQTQEDQEARHVHMMTSICSMQQVLQQLLEHASQKGNGSGEDRMLDRPSVSCPIPPVALPGPPCAG